MIVGYKLEPPGQVDSRLVEEAEKQHDIFKDDFRGCPPADPGDPKDSGHLDNNGKKQGFVIFLVQEEQKDRNENEYFDNARPSASPEIYQARFENISETSMSRKTNNVVCPFSMAMRVAEKAK